MKCEPPKVSALVAPRDELDFLDCRKFSCPSGISALEVYRLATGSTPWPLRIAFSIRDRISGFFGVRAIGGFDPTMLPDQASAGDALHFFTIEEINDQHLALAARDVHLETVLSLDIVEAGDGRALCYVSSSVITKNLFGKAYMAPVSLVHGMIVEYLLGHVLTSQDH